MRGNVNPIIAIFAIIGALVILGLVLSIPIVMLTSARGPGQWLRRRRIFCTPEELAPPPVLVRASELRASRGGDGEA